MVAASTGGGGDGPGAPPPGAGAIAEMQQQAREPERYHIGDARDRSRSPPPGGPPPPPPPPPTGEQRLDAIAKKLKEKTASKAYSQGFHSTKGGEAHKSQKPRRTAPEVPKAPAAVKPSRQPANDEDTAAYNPPKRARPSKAPAKPSVAAPKPSKAPARPSKAPARPSAAPPTESSSKSKVIKEAPSYSKTPGKKTKLTPGRMK